MATYPVTSQVEISVMVSLTYDVSLDNDDDETNVSHKLIYRAYIPSLRLSVLRVDSVGEEARHLRLSGEFSVRPRPEVLSPRHPRAESLFMRGRDLRCADC